MGNRSSAFCPIDDQPVLSRLTGGPCIDAGALRIGRRFVRNGDVVARVRRRVMHRRRGFSHNGHALTRKGCAVTCNCRRVTNNGSAATHDDRRLTLVRRLVTRFARCVMLVGYA